MDKLPLIRAPSRDQTCNPGMCPNWESNRRLFALTADAQPTEPDRSGALRTVLLHTCGFSIAKFVLHNPGPLSHLMDINPDLMELSVSSWE